MKNIALFMGLNDAYERGIARGVVRYSKTRPDWKLYGYGWMFGSIDDPSSWAGDGIIARVESRADADLLSSLSVTVVDVAGAYLSSGFLEVNNDDFSTGRKAGEYVLSCGFKRFAFCGVREVGWSEKRHDGFLHALRGAGVSCVPSFEESLSWWERQGASDDFKRFIRELRPPVAVFACNDTVGLKLTAFLKGTSYRVPDDVSVLGVDNEDILCELSSPSLTSISLDCERIGFEAAARLDAVFAGKINAAHKSSRTPLLVPPKDLLERESTKPFSCGDGFVEHAVRFIREHACEGIDVSDVIERIPLSRRALEIRFRKETGRSMHEEIVFIKLAMAKRLLRHSDEPVYRIAEECGFGTLQRFYGLFRAETGCSPLEFRRLSVS